jgi:hypothetical protein
MEARRVSKGLDINTGRTYTPAEAQAMLARLVANPIPVTNATMTLDSYFSPYMGYQRVNFVPGKPGYHVEDPRIEDEQAKPEKPETRFVTASTYGRVIPISLGRRRMEGNLIQSSNLVPRMVGTTTKTIEYEVPIYEDPPVDEDLGFHLDDTGGTDPTGEPTQTCGQPDACDTRISTPEEPSDPIDPDPDPPPDEDVPEDNFYASAHCGPWDEGAAQFLSCERARRDLLNNHQAVGWFPTLEAAHAEADALGWTVAGGGDGECAVAVWDFGPDCTTQGVLVAVFS